MSRSITCSGCTLRAVNRLSGKWTGGVRNRRPNGRKALPATTAFFGLRLQFVGLTTKLSRSVKQRGAFKVSVLRETSRTVYADEQLASGLPRSGHEARSRGRHQGLYGPGCEESGRFVVDHRGWGIGSASLALDIFSHYWRLFFRGFPKNGAESRNSLAFSCFSQSATHWRAAA
jgi:hypothetical protein